MLGLPGSEFVSDSAQNDGTLANTLARAQVRKFFEEPHVGQFAGIALCVKLLDGLEEDQGLAAIAQALKKAVHQAGNRLPPTIVFAFGALSEIALRKRDFQEAEYWERQTIVFHEHLERLLSPPSPAIQMEWDRNLSSAWGLIGLATLLRGIPEEAEPALQKALELAIAAKDVKLQGNAVLNLGQLAFKRSEAEQALELLRQAVVLARAGGSAKIQWESLSIQSHILMMIGEYAAPFLEIVVSPGGEAATRVEIMQREFSGQTEQLPTRFLDLLNLPQYESRPWRGIDLGKCLYRSAMAANDPALIVKSLQVMADACQKAGDYRQAEKFWLQMLDLDPPIPVGQQAFGMAKLAGVKSYLGLLQDARTLLSNAEELNSERSEAATIGPDEALRNVLAIAEEIARFDSPQAALASMERQSATAGMVTDQHLLDQRDELVRSFTAAIKAAAIHEGRIVTVTIGERPNLSRQQREVLERESQDPDDWHLLGQLAMTSGDFHSARRLLTRAAAAFSEQQNSRELARTLVDLGSLAGMQGNWYESVETYQRALKIEESLGEPERQIPVLARLASAYVQLKDDSAALKAALRVLELTRNRGASPHTLMALYVCVLAYGTGHLPEALSAMERFVETFPQVHGAQSLARIQKQFQESLRRIRSVKVGSYSRSFGLGIAFSNQIEEAQRLQQIGELRQALDVLAMLESEDRTYVERAWIYRMRGNAFQTAGQHGEAVSNYTEASPLFRQAGLPDEELITDIQKSVSLRGSGKADEAEAELRRLLVSLPPGLVRFQALLTLANTLTQSLPQSINASDVLTEARTLYDEARAIPGLSAEHIGLVESNAANLDAWEGKFDEALRKLRLAHKHLLRCNSRYLPSCELAIRNAERHHSEDTKS